MSDERPDDDLKAWAEWNRKPGDERPDVQHEVWKHRWCADDAAMATRAYNELIRSEAENRRLREALEKKQPVYPPGMEMSQSCKHAQHQKCEGKTCWCACHLKKAAADTGRPSE